MFHDTSGTLAPSLDVGSCTNLQATMLEFRVESLQRVRIAPRQIQLRFLNHLPPQGIRIGIENRSGIPLKNEPRTQCYFSPQLIVTPSGIA